MTGPLCRSSTWPLRPVARRCERNMWESSALQAAFCLPGPEVLLGLDGQQAPLFGQALRLGSLFEQGAPLQPGWPVRARVGQVFIPGSLVSKEVRLGLDGQQALLFARRYAAAASFERGAPLQPGWPAIVCTGQVICPGSLVRRSSSAWMASKLLSGQALNLGSLMSKAPHRGLRSSKLSALAAC